MHSLAVEVLGLWVLGAVLAGFWVLGLWVLEVVILGYWCPNSVFEELAEGRNTLSSPCGAVWDLPERAREDLRMGREPESRR